MNATALTLSPHWIGKNGKAVLTAKIGDRVLATDKLDLSSAADRQRFASDLVKDRPGIDAGAIEDQLLQLAGTRATANPAGAADAANVADLLVELADDAEVFRDPSGVGYASIPAGDHHETHKIKSASFRLWLRRRLREVHDRTAYGEGLTQAVEEIESRAIFGERIEPVAVRVAGRPGEIWIDLADDRWRAVRVTADGWSVETDVPIKFLRPRGLLPLVEPVEAEGTVEDLRPFVNCDDDAFVLVVAWLLCALRPAGPYPVIQCEGEQGSGKSSVAKLLRSLVDPSVVPLRSEPREPRDLAVAAGNAWAIIFDNLTHVPVWLSDSLCRLATGGGFSTRELYSDDREILFEAMRPVVLTGIEPTAVRPDLLDRTLTVAFHAIPESQRRTEADLAAAFSPVRPAVLGALLTAVSAGLRHVADVKLPRLPRMADSAVWLTACEPGLGWPAGTFAAALDRSRAEANQTALDHSAVGPLVLSLLANRQDWSGTAGELLIALSDLASEDLRHSPRWPSDPTRLSAGLTRIASNLRAVGVEVTRRKDGPSRRRLIVLSKGPVAAPAVEPTLLFRSPSKESESWSPSLNA